MCIDLCLDCDACLWFHQYLVFKSDILGARMIWVSFTNWTKTCSAVHRRKICFTVAADKALIETISHLNGVETGPDVLDEGCPERLHQQAKGEWCKRSLYSRGGGRGGLTTQTAVKLSHAEMSCCRTFNMIRQASCNFLMRLNDVSAVV